MAAIPAEAATGGLVIGHVTDSSTSEGVSGALVTGALGNDKTRSLVEPLDTANGNGVFVLFSSVSGPVSITATEADHEGEDTGRQCLDLAGSASLDFSVVSTVPRRLPRCCLPWSRPRGGASITITGTAFVSGATSVTVRGVAATDVVVTSKTLSCARCPRVHWAAPPSS